MGKIVENMPWPPNGFLEYKMAEHSAWYSGDAEVLANFYNLLIYRNVLNMPYPLKNEGKFWGRQIKNQGEIFVHVPIAGDIANTSADLLFSESPLIKVKQAQEEKSAQGYKDTQEELETMLANNGFYHKIVEGAETDAAIGGVFIKLAYDNELSPYPIPVVVQADKGIPEFKFGILTEANFWRVVEEDESHSKVFRLIETYTKDGSILYKLYKGTSDKLGKEVPLNTCEETKGLMPIETCVDDILCVYIPNMLPNRLDRSSYLGRSDYSGIEGLMDSLDDTFSSWMKDIAVAQGSILLPESYLKTNSNGDKRFNMDQMVYVKLDIDPIASQKETITVNQFDIRAEQFEKTSLNFLERIIVSSGYSPQSFGLSIAGRAESGTALSIRERKSFATKKKKEQYWKPALKKLIELQIKLYIAELGGKMEADSDVNIELSDSITNNLSEVATAVKMVADAQAASVETKVALIHPDWTKEQISAETKKIIKENNIGAQMEFPDDNADLEQIEFEKKKQAEKDKAGK